MTVQRMDNLLTWDYGLLAVLAAALFAAVIWLGKVLLLRREAPPRRQRQGRDRRSDRPMPPVPFYDSERRLVTADRRRGERRGRHIVFTTTQQLRARSGRR